MNNMEYISGVHALNIPCELDTCGDWHVSSLDWENITLMTSKDSIFGNYGIETDKIIPEHSERYNVANTLRAILDLMYLGKTGYLIGFKEDFICNDKYTYELFEKVLLLKDCNNWNKIDKLMTHEYYNQWVRYKEKHNV